jgi:DNA modification methylase
MYNPTSSHGIDQSPTVHRLVQADARDLDFVPDRSVHLIVTSPPYWILKRYNENPSQLGHIPDYEQFIQELSKVWKHCLRVLVPGGRLVCVVGDVCLSRRKYGRHVVMPLHSDIAVACRKAGFDNLNPIIWYKIANASYEVNNGAKFLGKPYEPNAIIKNDIEFILMQRKPGGYRSPTQQQRRLSMIDKQDYEAWFRQVWDIPGASTRQHPAPFPYALAYRLVRMFSFHGDTVLDPFCGTGTTMIAALRTGRHSVGVEIDREYCRLAAHRLKSETATLFSKARLVFEKAEQNAEGHLQIREEPEMYAVHRLETRSAKGVA